jgi:hypothetical protein
MDISSFPNYGSNKVISYQKLRMREFTVMAGTAKMTTSQPGSSLSDLRKGKSWERGL